MGPCSPSAHPCRGRLSPIYTSRHFWRRCPQSHLQTSPTTHQMLYAKFWNSKTAFQNTHPALCPPTNHIMLYFYFLVHAYVSPHLWKIDWVHLCICKKIGEKNAHLCTYKESFNHKKKSWTQFGTAHDFAFVLFIFVPKLCMQLIHQYECFNV